VFVTSTALERRGSEILTGLVASFTLGVGQFCTKPGIVLIPSGEGVEQAISTLVRGRTPERMLTPATAARYGANLHGLESHPAIEILVGEDAEAAGDGVLPTVLLTHVTALLDHRDELLVECFGPVTLLVTYDDEAQMLLVADALEGQLTASVHGEEDEAFLPGLIERLSERAGRVVWNEWPTGVAVSWAMTHGGPYPATTSSSHTAVGTAAIERFLRPVTLQSVPPPLLPPALAEENPLGLPRRINGVLSAAPAGRPR
jgi:NADP-dependent aldehyde dehydrogenase